MDSIELVFRDVLDLLWGPPYSCPCSANNRKKSPLSPMNIRGSIKFYPSSPYTSLYSYWGVIK